ncbi:MAG: hypothetical protein HYZ25_12820 [Chloroflexi bacterium]|nr:hypothetical protein [Chloroflexota bacterium]
MPRYFTHVNELDVQKVRELYDGFDAPIARLDCGKKCAPYNPSGKPFCCDICHAVPAAYQSEWAYLQPNTNLWHEWRGDECGSAQEVDTLKAETPESMILLACLGPDRCQRDFRALSCRQFPFFPYVTADYRFVGMAYEWEFESKCWVISNLSQVSVRYREEFIRTYDELFALFQDEFDSYAVHSEEMRAHFIEQKRRIPILHRNGGVYLLSPASERMVRVEAGKLPKFEPYK